MPRIRTKAVFFSLVSIFCALNILLSACGSGNGNGTNTTTVAAKQVLRLASIGGFDTLDPALTAGGLGDPFNLIFSNLVTADDQGKIHDNMASSHQVSADGLTYTFSLRPGLKFSNGQKLDANDVAYSLNRTIDPATKSPVSSYLGLLKNYDALAGGKAKTLIGDSIIVKDPNTLVLVLSKPAAYFLASLNYATGDVVNKNLVTQYGTGWLNHLEEGGGSGPFKVKSYNPSKGLVLVPNPNYYGFKPKLQEINYTITSDRNSTFKSMKAGQFDLAPVPPADTNANKNLPGYQTTSALAMRFIGMNYLVKPLDNIKIRQGLELALNKTLLVDSILGKGFVTPSYHIILDGIPGYNPNLQGPAGVNSLSGDQEKAKTLFQEGMKEEGYSSVSQRPTITLAYDQSYKAAGDTMNAVANEWKQVLGFTVKPFGLQPTDLINQEFQTNGKAGPLQMFYGNWVADYEDPQDFTTIFFGKGAQQNAFNYGQNKSANAAAQQAVQEELLKADTTQDPEARLKLYQDAEQKLVNDVPYITTYQSSYSYLVNPKLHGWKIQPTGSMAPGDWADVYFTN